MECWMLPCSAKASFTHDNRWSWRLALEDGRSCSIARMSTKITCRIGTQRSHQERKRESWRGYVVAAAAASSSVEKESNARMLVDDLLSLVESSDRGALLAQQEQSRVEELIGSLEQHCIREPLQSPLLFGEWDVVYSSNPTATGGYYRSAVGRTLLRTNKMMQVVKEPDFVSNKVSFAALGVLQGEVSLKGKLEALDNRWIKITFDPPNLRLGPIEFQYGGITSVKIAIIYLDERVRLGRGSRGSLFVFKRC
eukprot:c2370_g1_i1 orf=260-1018(+)